MRQEIELHMYTRCHMEAGPTLEQIFRDVISAGVLPFEPPYPRMCEANRRTI